MICAMDVQYGPERATAAAILFETWESTVVVARHRLDLQSQAPYAPGRFYLRELPCLEALIAQIERPVGIYLVDGYV